VPRCFLAFSAVVADNQYAALGLMLMGTLARLNDLIVPPKDDEDEVLEDGVGLDASIGHVSPKEDLGEAIRRESVDEKLGTRVIDKIEDEDTEGMVPKSVEKSRKKRTRLVESELDNVPEQVTPKLPKKRRKKGDAIDDLFSSLI